jgi:riboflavin transporter FmnP
MNTRAIAMTIAFAAVTVVLNPRFSGIAIPFVPPLWFQIWEIPVVAAFFLVGLKSGVGIALLNVAVLQAVSPGVPFNQPLANLVAIWGTLLGVYLAYKIILRNVSEEAAFPERKLIVSSTALGILLRVAIMMPFLYMLAILLVRPEIIVFLPLLAFHDVIVALYTVPLGYLVAKMVSKSLKLRPAKHSFEE